MGIAQHHQHHSACTAAAGRLEYPITLSFPPLITGGFRVEGKGAPPSTARGHCRIVGTGDRAIRRLLILLTGTEPLIAGHQVYPIYTKPKLHSILNLFQIPNLDCTYTNPLLALYGKCIASESTLHLCWGYTLYCTYTSCRLSGTVVKCTHALM